MCLVRDALDLSFLHAHLRAEAGGDTRNVTNMLFYLDFHMDAGAHGCGSSLRISFRCEKPGRDPLGKKAVAGSTAACGARQPPADPARLHAGPRRTRPVHRARAHDHEHAERHGRHGHERNGHVRHGHVAAYWNAGSGRPYAGSRELRRLAFCRCCHHHGSARRAHSLSAQPIRFRGHRFTSRAFHPSRHDRADTAPPRPTCAGLENFEPDTSACGRQ